MFPASLAHTLTGNTFGDIEGGFLSNNTTHICINTGEGTCIHTVQEGQVPGISMSSGIPIAHKHELRLLRSQPYGSDLVTRDGYRIHVAKYRGKVVAVKVYQGANSNKRLEADLEINSSLFHPTILQTVAVCRAPRAPFLVFSIESDSLSTIPISLGGFKSLVYYLADALSHSEQESLVAGAQLIRDVSAGLDHLSSIEQSPALSRFIFDLLVDENNNICIAVGLSDQVDTDVQMDGYLSVFQRLISKSFLEANNQHHIDKEWAITAGDFGQALDDSSSDDRDFLVQLESEPTEIVDLASIEIPSREYVFIPDRASNSFSLSAISTDYTNFIRRINPNNASSNNFQRWRHKGPSKSKTVAHRCPGYRRDEVTLGTSVSRTAVIQHLTPSLREICPICKQLVEDGMFNCSCGQEDDGSSPTIQCSRCLVWSHHRCQRNDSGSDHQPFTCFSCHESNDLMATETADDTAPPSSRGALTQALEFAREAVQLDATNDHPEEAAMAYGRSVALLSEVMERVRRGKSSEVSSKRRNGQPRSVAQEAEVRRLQNIHDTYADRMNILRIIYNIPSPMYSGLGDSTQSTSPTTSGSRMSHTAELQIPQPSYVNMQDQLYQDLPLDFLNQKRAEGGVEAIGAAMFLQDLPTSPIQSISGQAQLSSHLYASATSQHNVQISPQMSSSNRASLRSRRSQRASALPPALPPPATSLPPVPTVFVPIEGFRNLRR